MRQRIRALAEEARTELALATDPARVEELRIRYLGKKGELASALSAMGKLPPDERRTVGEVVNQVKAELEGLLAEAVTRVEDARLELELRGPRLDVTQPGRGRVPGRRHPVSRTMDEIVSVFARLGFEVATGPEVELDYYNFEALNVPPDHPARDMQDTFYVDSAYLERKPASPVLLRTHTSPVQVRAMLGKKPPLRVVCPGRVYRRDSDLTHTPMFHQVEILYVAPGVTFAELKGTLAEFIRAMFGADTKMRLRPSFFPFTEPSAEVDISCVLCGGSGRHSPGEPCRVCKTSGWLEVLGAGMVHPNVLRASGYDPNQVTGFAAGMGVERLTMLRYRIDDLRIMFENDVRFLEQF